MARNGMGFSHAEGSMSKLKAGEVATRVTDEAIQILGGYGFIRDFPVEKWHRDAKIYTLFEGTSEIQRLVISRANGGMALGTRDLHRSHRRGIGCRPVNCEEAAWAWSSGTRTGPSAGSTWGRTTPPGRGVLRGVVRVGVRRPAHGGAGDLLDLPAEGAGGGRAVRPGGAAGVGSYISVGDADRATARARELGAEVLVEPFDTPGGGRVATVRDPAGAVVSLSRPGERYGAEVVNEDGAWTWNELVSGDLAAARDFYVELFGWSADDASAGIPRTAFTLGGLLVGGARADAGGPVAPLERGLLGGRRRRGGGEDPGAGRDGAAAADGHPRRPVHDRRPQGAVFTASAVPGGPARGLDGS